MRMVEMRFFQNNGYDVETEKFGMKEYYYLLQLSGLLLYTRGKWIWLALFHLFFFFSIIISALYMLANAAYLLKDYQLSIAALTFHITSGFMSSFVSLMSINYNRATFTELLTIFHNGYYNYGKTVYYEEVEKWNKSFQKSQTKLAIFLPFYCSLIGISAMVQPLMDAYQGTTLNVSYVNGVYMELPQPLYLPLIVNSDTKKFGWFCYEIFATTVILMTVCSPILIIIKTTFSIGNQLRILLHYIENIEERSLYHCKQKNSMFIKPQHPSKLYSHPLFVEEYEKCMKQNIDHFFMIRRSVRLFDRLQRWPMFCAVFVFSAVLACALLTLIKGDTRLAPQVLSMLLLLMEAAAVATICEGGERISTYSEAVFSSFYKSKWILCSPKIKKNIIILQECSKNPLCIKAGGFSKINWELFAGIMNSAYTYFNLLYAMDK